VATCFPPVAASPGRSPNGTSRSEEVPWGDDLTACPSRAPDGGAMPHGEACGARAVARASQRRATPVPRARLRAQALSLRRSGTTRDEGQPSICVSRRIRASVKTSSSSLLRVENSDTIAPSSPAWNQWSVFGITVN
jgi:hypothetical protein